jgi:hypothetical protein
VPEEKEVNAGRLVRCPLCGAELKRRSLRLHAWNHVLDLRRLKLLDAGAGDGGGYWVEVAGTRIPFSATPEFLTRLALLIGGNRRLLVPRRRGSGEGRRRRRRLALLRLRLHAKKLRKLESEVRRQRRRLVVAQFFDEKGGAYICRLCRRKFRGEVAAYQHAVAAHREARFRADQAAARIAQQLGAPRCVLKMVFRERKEPPPLF